MNFPLVHVLGTEIRAHWSWVPVLALITVFFGADITAADAPGWVPPWAWVTSAAIALLVFVSVMAHELAHVVVASRNGLKFPVAVVQLLGGPYVMGLRPLTPGQEFRAAAAGPAISVVLSLAFGALSVALSLGPAGVATAPVTLQALQFVAVMLAVFNLFLAAVNLVPGYPLDGARILHAIAWQRTGVETAATQSAVRTGRYVGWAFMLAGVGVMAMVDPVGGLALIIAGWLITGSSRLLDRRTFLQSLVAGLRVGDATDANPSRVPPQLTLDVFAGTYLAEQLGAAALVERGSELLGLIGTMQIRKVPRRSWTHTRTEQVMVPIGSVPRTSGDTPLWPALEALEQSGLDALLVSSPEGEPALFSRRSAARVVHERAEEHQRELMATGQGRGRFWRH